MTIIVRPLIKALLIVCVPGFFSSMAKAAVDAGALQQNLEKQLPPARALPEPGKLKPSDAPTAKENDVRFQVNAFSLEGVNTLPESQVQAVLKPYLGIQLTFSDLEKACDAITNLYRENGYSVQAVVLPQSMSKTGGTVKLRITEAKLSSVVINVLNADNRFGSKRVEQFITDTNPIGQPLNLNKIERSLIILNEIPGVMVSSQLDAGKEQGDTDLRVNLGETPLIQGRTEVNNLGSRSTGISQVISALSFNNVTGIGDQIALNGIASKGSQYAHVSYSFPAGTSGLRLGAYGTYLNYENVGAFALPNGAYGDSKTHGINASYPLIRNKNSNLNASLSYDTKRYLNELMATNTVNSAYNIKNLVLGLSGNSFDNFGGDAVSNGSVAITFGSLDILPTSMSGYGAYTPPHFTKITFSGSRNQSLNEEEKSSLFLAISGQLASVNLNSGEQFYLGGPYGVRAYPVSQGGGAQGLLLTAEIRHRLPNNLTSSAFVDVGMVQQYKHTFSEWQGKTHATNTYTLKGSGIGLKWSEGKWNVSGSLAFVLGSNPLYNQKGDMVNNDDRADQVRAWINISYSF
jgi:hemolysin activation/secretion protein